MKRITVTITEWISNISVLLTGEKYTYEIVGSNVVINLKKEIATELGF